MRKKWPRVELARSKDAFRPGLHVGISRAELRVHSRAALNNINIEKMFRLDPL
jgi:hypothetical protein